MSAEYQLRIIDTAGATQAVITDFLALAFTRVLNEPGLIAFSLSDGHAALPYIVHNNQVEVWRKNADIGLDWGASPEFVGIIRSLVWSTDETTALSVQAPGVMSILSWRVIGYRAGILLRSDFVDDPPETIMKNIVAYNCTSSGTTTDGRIRAATTSGKVSNLYTVTVETDLARGTAITKGCAWDNVLEAVQGVQLTSAADFDLVKTAATTFQFRYYPGQRGTDRTASLVFSLERGNMVAPSFIDSRIEERTSVIVGGKGEAQQRAVSVATGANYTTSRDIEVFADATQEDTDAGRQEFGRERLKTLQSKSHFTFGALQAPNAYYGLHYTLGDKVTAVYRGVSSTQKVRAVSVQFDDTQGEVIAIEFEEAS